MVKTIASFKHRVALCTMADVVDDGGTMRLTRDEVFRTWACIETKQGSMFAPDGVTIRETRERKTHEIYIRYRYNATISSAAWIYEERRKSEPRWYKILSVGDDGELWKFKVRLVEKSDDISAPVNPETQEPTVLMPQGQVWS